MSTDVTDLLLLAAYLIFLGLLVALLLSMRPDKKKTHSRTCPACGHDKGWHPTYWSATTSELTCKATHDCHCPAGRRSIR